MTHATTRSPRTTRSRSSPNAGTGEDRQRRALRLIGFTFAAPAAGYVLVYYAGREVREIFSSLA